MMISFMKFTTMKCADIDIEEEEHGKFSTADAGGRYKTG
jgi:hypothetical protein